MNQSDQIDALAAALSKAQGQVEGAKKDSANPHFKSKYADLESVWAACREALTGNGLAVLQSPGLTHDGVMHMTTQLTHSSGQWIRGEMSLPLSKVDPQGAGSALTYMRRYALAAFVGVAPEDDDGNAASNRSAPSPSTPRDARISDEQRHQLITLIETTNTDTKALCDNYRVSSLAELTVPMFANAKAVLERRAKGNANGTA